MRSLRSCHRTPVALCRLQPSQCFVKGFGDIRCGSRARTSKVLNGTLAPYPKVWTGIGHRGRRAAFKEETIKIGPRWLVSEAMAITRYSPVVLLLRR